MELFPSLCQPSKVHFKVAHPICIIMSAIPVFNGFSIVASSNGDLSACPRLGCRSSAEMIFPGVEHPSGNAARVTDDSAGSHPHKGSRGGKESNVK
jgi:hypothetical protein